jgi:hypothetical protein
MMRRQQTFQLRLTRQASTKTRTADWCLHFFFSQFLGQTMQEEEEEER